MKNIHFKVTHSLHIYFIAVNVVIIFGLWTKWFMQISQTEYYKFKRELAGFNSFFSISQLFKECVFLYYQPFNFE